MRILSQVSGQVYRRKKVLLTRLGIGALGCGYLFLGVMTLRNRSWAPAAIVLLAAVFFLVIALRYHQIAAWRASRMALKGMEEMTIDLEEDGLRGRSDKGEGFYPYDAFIGAFYCENRYLLFADERHAVLLPERAITKGDLGELGPWLSGKLGKEIVKL